MSNLLSNASKFQEIGDILVKAQVIIKKNLNDIERKPKLLLEVSVHDTGIGMTEEET